MVGDFACTSFDHAQYSDIYYCPKCKNGFIKDVISDGDNTFLIDGIKKYEEIVDKEYLKNIEGRYLTSRNIVKKYSQFFKDKNVLEVGAYYGAFAHEVLGIAKSYTGIELSKHAAAHLRNEYLNSFIFDGTVDEFRDRCPENIGKFDTIVLFDVIEHVPDPIKILNILNSLLKDSGTIIFSTINIESSVCMALGPFWPWYMDMHYYYFSDRGYKILLQRSGFLLRKHAHFGYRIHASYLVKKIISMIFGVRRIPSQIESLLKFMISIKTGETVLVLGQKK